MTTDQCPIAIRPELPTDRGFVVTRWRSSLRKRSPYRDLDAGFYHAAMGVIIDAVLSDPGTDVLVASDVEDPDVVLGFVVADPYQRLLHYMYTRTRLRGRGVASRLIDAAFSGTEPVTATIATAPLRRHAKRWGVQIDSARLLDYTAPHRPTGCHG